MDVIFIKWIQPFYGGKVKNITDYRKLIFREEAVTQDELQLRMMNGKQGIIRKYNGMFFKDEAGH